MSIFWGWFFHVFGGKKNLQISFENTTVYKKNLSCFLPPKTCFFLVFCTWKEILARIIGHENWIRSHMNKWVAGRCWITNKDCRLQTGFPIYENFFTIIHRSNLGHCIVGRNYFFVPNRLNNGILAIMRRNQLPFRPEYLKNYERNSAKTFPENWDSKALSVGTLLAYLETTA